MKRVCLKCGTEFEGRPDSTLCKSCADESIRSVIRQRVCKICGVSFPGYPGSKYCPTCAAEQKKKRTAEFKERKRAGTVRKIGSIDICQQCGKEYTVNGGLQKYCPDCAPEAIASNDNAKSREWNAANVDYDVKRQDRQKSSAMRTCVICGAQFIPDTAAMTCSEECSRKLQRKTATEWEKSHRGQRNQYQSARIAKKLDDMTEEEKAEYRAKINARARENYKKRKEREEKPND